MNNTIHFRDFYSSLQKKITYCRRIYEEVNVKITGVFFHIKIFLINVD
jgi:hypothetical protein